MSLTQVLGMLGRDLDARDGSRYRAAFEDGLAADEVSADEGELQGERGGVHGTLVPEVTAGAAKGEAAAAAERDGEEEEQQGDEEEKEEVEEEEEEEEEEDRDINDDDMARYRAALALNRKKREQEHEHEQGKEVVSGASGVGERGGSEEREGTAVKVRAIMVGGRDDFTEVGYIDLLLEEGDGWVWRPARSVRRVKNLWRGR